MDNHSIGNMYNLAKMSQRFVAFIIDMIILSIFTAGITFSISKIAKVKEPEMVKADAQITEFARSTLKKEFGSNFQVLFENDEDLPAFVATMELDKWELYLKSNEEIRESFLLYYNECTVYQSEFSKYSNTSLGISFGTYILGIILLFDVLGLLWSKQTPGRALMKIKVIDENGNAPTFTKLLVRDVVGYGLLSLLNCCCFIPLIANIIYISGPRGRSIGDMISKTYMIRTDIEQQSNTLEEVEVIE